MESLALLDKLVVKHLGKEGSTAENILLQMSTKLTPTKLPRPSFGTSKTLSQIKIPKLNKETQVTSP